VEAIGCGAVAEGRNVKQKKKEKSRQVADGFIYLFILYIYIFFFFLCRGPKMWALRRNATQLLN